MALGLGMKVLAFDPFVKEAAIEIEIEGANAVKVKIIPIELDKVLQNSATTTTSSGATIPTKSKMGYDKKSKEYTNPNPLPAK